MKNMQVCTRYPLDILCVFSYMIPSFSCHYDPYLNIFYLGLYPCPAEGACWTGERAPF